MRGLATRPLRPSLKPVTSRLIVPENEPRTAGTWGPNPMTSQGARRRGSWGGGPSPIRTECLDDQKRGGRGEGTWQRAGGYEWELRAGGGGLCGLISQNSPCAFQMQKLRARSD